MQIVQSTINIPSGAVWVLDSAVTAGILERLGDARHIADRLKIDVAVLLIETTTGDVADSDDLIARGADHVVCVKVDRTGPETLIDAAAEVLSNSGFRPRLVLAAGDGAGRAWVTRLAVRCRWQLVSPALLVQARTNQMTAIALDSTGKYARQVDLPSEQTSLVTLRPDLGKPRTADSGRRGTVHRLTHPSRIETTVVEQHYPADPAVADIRFVRRLIAGGRGLGGPDGFDVLKRVAVRLQAGVAASRMAVDLGWIDHARQVGQTGRTVKPDVYIACGISGASHHLDGMAESTHIVAINTDAAAPIFKVAHLGLVAELYAVLQNFEQEFTT